MFLAVKETSLVLKLPGSLLSETSDLPTFTSHRASITQWAAVHHTPPLAACSHHRSGSRPRRLNGYTSFSHRRIEAGCPGRFVHRGSQEGLFLPFQLALDVNLRLLTNQKFFAPACRSGQGHGDQTNSRTNWLQLELAMTVFQRWKSCGFNDPQILVIWCRRCCFCCPRDVGSCLGTESHIDLTAYVS